jgi:hypothetical protein
MIVLCSWCIREGKPSFIREKPPYEDTRISHGICDPHETELRARAETLHAERMAPANRTRAPR